MTIKRLPLEANGHLLSHANEVSVLYSVCDEEPMVLHTWYGCAICDHHPTFRVTDTGVFVKEPCPYPDGITTEVLLQVPSGKMIVTDDLRPVYTWDCDDKAFASYNSALGQAQAVEAMAAVGCAYGPVGNTCPGMYRVGEDRFIIAALEYDPDTDELVLPEGAHEVASVCTDLWAYSIADFEHWKSRGGDPEKLDWTHEVVDVTPGTYRFVHHSGKRDFDRDFAGTVVFADVERIA